MAERLLSMIKGMSFVGKLGDRYGDTVNKVIGLRVIGMGTESTNR